MNELPLPALDGRKALGFLAALGVTRLLERFDGEQPRLRWARDTTAAVIHTRHETIDVLAGRLVEIASSIPENGVLPGVPDAFPPPGAAPDGLRLPPEQLGDLAAQLAPVPDPELEAWLASLVTDLSVDDNGRSDISLMAAPSGKQSMRTMLEKPLQFVRDNPGCIREALLGWRRYPGVTGEYLDHQVLFDAAHSGSGKSEERGVPGATWLALMSYPLLRTTAILTASGNGEPITSGWHRRAKRPPSFVYPLWTEPLVVDAIVALLELPLWDQPFDSALPAEAAALRVFAVHRFQRRRIAGRTFSGVMAPVP